MRSFAMGLVMILTTTLVFAKPQRETTKREKYQKMPSSGTTQGDKICALTWFGPWHF
jgi:hypothetical protein